jgi:glucose/mannose transport system substrate-binding protein
LAPFDPHAPPAPFKVTSFWDNDRKEKEALQAFTSKVSDPYTPVSEGYGDRVATQQGILRDLFDGHELPDVFQVNGGSDVLRWAQQPHADDREVCSLDSLERSYGYHQRYFDRALGPLQCHGSLYGLPVGVHRVNVLFYNTKLLQELQGVARSKGKVLGAPEDLESTEQLVQLLNDVKELDARTEEGKAIVPLALGTSKDWPLTIVAFENVLLSLADEHFDPYTTLWTGRLTADDDASAKSLEEGLNRMLSLLRSLNDLSNGDETLDWQQALVQVGTGEALMTITGDWGYAQLEDWMLPDVETIAFPGTRGKFAYTPDSFAVPREFSKDGSAARHFLHDIVEDKANLIAFSNRKFSIPPRTDLEPTELAQFVGHVQKTYEEFRSCNDNTSDCQLVLAVSGLAPPPGADPCFDDMEALLSVAVRGRAVKARDASRCEKGLPSGARQAGAQLIELLKQVAQRPFAEACR